MVLLCILSCVMLLASPAFANHFPAEVDYLNGTQLLEVHQARDYQTGERFRWEVRHDERANIRYFVRCRADERIDRVWRRSEDGSAALIYSVDGNRTARCQNSH